MRRLFAAAALLAAWAGAAGCGGRHGSSAYPDVELRTLASETKEPVKGCSTSRCLYLYVAPWCGVCRRSTGMFGELRAHLEKRGVDMRIIVGDDDPGDVLAYARDFGPSTLLDPNAKAKRRGGVPQFIVTDRDGTIRGTQSGVPAILNTPVPPPILTYIGAALGALDDSDEARQGLAMLRGGRLPAGRDRQPEPERRVDPAEDDDVVPSL